MEMEKETESAPVEAPASASEPADAGMEISEKEPEPEVTVIGVVENSRKDMFPEHPGNSGNHLAYENLSPEPVEPPPATTAPASLPAPLAVHAPAVMPPPYTPPVYSAFQPVGQPGQPMQFMVPPPDMHIAHALAAQPWALSAIIAALKPHIPDPATFGNQGFESQRTSQVNQETSQGNQERIQVRVSDRGFFGSTGLGDSGNTQVKPENSPGDREGFQSRQSGSGNRRRERTDEWLRWRWNAPWGAVPPAHWKLQTANPTDPIPDPEDRRSLYDCFRKPRSGTERRLWKLRRIRPPSGKTSFPTLYAVARPI